jgi:hypothetical protein
MGQGAGVPPAALPPPSPGCVASAPRPGPSPLRRLTRFEYDASVRALLGDSSAPARAFPGQHVRFGGAPANKLYVTFMNAMGIEAQEFGDPRHGIGPLAGLG